MDKDAPSPDNDGHDDGEPPWVEDPIWDSEAYNHHLEKMAEEISGMIPEMPFLSDEDCSGIAEALKIDDLKFKLIILALYNGLECREMAQDITSDLNEAFSTLHLISDKLTEVAEELNGASRDVRRLLNLAYSSSGERGMKSSLQKLIDPLMPVDREWCMAHEEERFDGISEDHALELIESVQRPMRMLLELVPQKPRGSPGRTYRNAIIRELAKAYEEVAGEIPTCTPTGRFVLLCQFTLGVLGVDDTGLENAVQRTLRDLKAG